MRACIGEGTKDMGNARKESAVEIKHAQEALESRKVSRSREGKDGMDFGGKWLKVSRSNMVTQAVNFWCGECTFSRIDAEAIGSQYIKDLTEMLEMLGTV